MQIPVDKIGEVIGPKGKRINEIIALTGADIDIQDDGTVFIGSREGEGAEKALRDDRPIVNPHLPEVGERFEGTVVNTTTFGAFVNIAPGRDGLVHISKLGRGKRLPNVEEAVNVGDKLTVEVQEIDTEGKISLKPVGEGWDPPEGGWPRVEGDDGRGAGPREGTGGATGAAGRSWRRRGRGDRQRRDRGERGHARANVSPSEGCAPTRRRSRGPSTVRPSGRHRGDAQHALGGARASGSTSARATSDPASPARRTSSSISCSRGPGRRTACQIAEAFDAIGGDLNAFTAKEYTCYYCRVGDADLPMAVEFMSDMLQHSVIARPDLEAERMVILEEINMRRRRSWRPHPRRVRRDALEGPPARPARARYPGDHLRRRRGTRSSGSTSGLYRPPHFVIAAAGNL